MSSPLAAVVLCAGKGTRMKSEKAKVLHPILGRPLCAYPVSRALELEASPVVAVVGHQSGAVTAALQAEFPGKALRIALQAEQRGTADAVRSAQEALKDHPGAVLILYGDTPLLRRETLQGLLDAYHQGTAPLAMVTTFPKDPHGYGRVVRDGGGRVARVVEQKDCTPEQASLSECNAGLYVVDSRFLWTALSEVKSTNAQGELYLTDLVEAAARAGPVAAVQVDFAETAGVNDRAELAACAKVMQGRINTRHMKAGVTLQDPATTYIHDGARIGPDTEIGPLVSIHAGCEIASHVRIGQGCVLTHATLAEGTVVKPYSVLEGTP